MTEPAMPRGVALDVIAEPGTDPVGWRLTLTADDGPAETAETVTPEAAASRWLADQLTAGAAPGLADALQEKGFRLQRFGRPVSSPAPGERLIATQQTNRSVVVGEQVIVKWMHRMDDAEHPALRAARHLDDVGFVGVPATLGALTWRSPSERELPCAFVTDFQPGALDGWQWCVQALENGDRPDFPAELGLLTAQLHVALGTPTSRLPLPMLAVGAAQLTSWHTQARQRLDELTGQIGALDDAPAGREGDRPQYVPSVVLALHHKLMESVIDQLLDVRGRTPVQLIHGDLHVGQVLSWDGGLSVTDFDGSPVLGRTSARQSAARDVAQMLLSLDQVGRIVDRKSGFTRTVEINDWSGVARRQFLAAYRAELERVERPDVLDTRLLPAFLVEQACRDLLYTVRFLPRWAYATIDGLETILNDLPKPIERTPDV
jgi:maltokinase